ncbi:putative ORFan [Tupanvirus deep ocean]|uniref:ORFan n=2 Tax=Tupanvirus TaxID=2094720 RepID=A0AC62A8N8_9VIRU|nr:putative ORFan [Tupanvirus deep ocean]QKU33983.1 putative ORFan [Tupanvirus deep ocean]
MSSHDNCYRKALYPCFYGFHHRSDYIFMNVNEYPPSIPFMSGARGYFDLLPGE